MASFPILMRCKSHIPEQDIVVNLDGSVACTNSVQKADALEAAARSGLARQRQMDDYYGFRTIGETDLVDVGFVEACRQGPDWMWNEEQVISFSERSADVIDGCGECWDELSVGKLAPDGVRAARAEEVSYVTRYGVRKKAPIKECWKQTGKKPAGKHWIDTNKGDEVHPEYRSRLVAQEIKRDNRTDLFAATPPL